MLSPSDDRPRLSNDFAFEVTAEASDIDVLGHVSNLVYVRWVQDAAWMHSEAVGWDHAAYVAAGVAFVVRRHELDYLGSALEGDLLRVVTWVESWTAATSMRKTTITRQSDGRLLLRGATTWAMVSTANGRPVRIAKAISDAFAKS